MQQVPLPPGGLRAELSNAYRRLYNKLRIKGASTSSAAPPHILPGVRIVTSLDELLRVAKAVTFTTGDVAGGGVIVGITVPQGKRWRLYAYRVSRTTGDHTITQVFVTDTSEGGSVLIQEETAGTSIFQVLPGSPIPMDEGDSLSILLATGASGTWTTLCWVEEEDAF